MNLAGKNVGWALCGSFCTLGAALEQMKTFKEAGADVFPIVSHNVYATDTRFFTRDDLLAQVVSITERPVIHTIVDAEPIGPKKLLDLLVIAPCTGNTLAKLVNGITDTPVLMAAKAQLRCCRPVVLALCSNDALGLSARNLGAAAALRNVYLAPYYQDDPHQKPNSLIARMDLLGEACQKALDGEQLQPVVR
ncbi:MAG: dipicolinate synthase subunit B [Clostridia bacterium]|nr:dipicolinate synthase subunit B [Clostridia bacterium]